MSPTRSTEEVRDAWRARFPDVLDSEFDALLPIVNGGGPDSLRKLISAYRAGFRNGWNGGSRATAQAVTDQAPALLRQAADDAAGKVDDGG